MQRQAGNEKSQMKKEKKEKDSSLQKRQIQNSAPLVSPQDYFNKMAQPVAPPPKQFQPFPTPPSSSGNSAAQNNKWPDPPVAPVQNLEDTAKNLTQLGNLLTKV